MKKIVLFLLLSIPLFGQSITPYNTTYTALDSAAVYTGTIQLLSNIGSIGIIVKSDVGSATNGIRAEFYTKLSTGAYRLVRVREYTYTANDSTFAKYFTVDAPYFRVKYTNTTTDQTIFSLITMLYPNHNSVFINNSSSSPVLVSGSTLESANKTWANNSLTVSTEVDTISITATEWYNFKVFAVDDTIEVSLSGSFSTPKIAYPFTQITPYLNIDPATYPKVYIRRKGTGTATYNYSGEGY